MSIYRFYVYAYIRSTDSDTAKAGTPYYIGKGCDDRAWHRHRNVTTPKDKSKIVILESKLSEIGSLAIERRLISWWGRKCNLSGVLLNKNEGGEGIQAGTKFSIEHRQKISLAKTGKSLSVATRHKQSCSHSGKQKSSETVEKFSQRMKGKTTVFDKVGLSFVTISSDEYQSNKTRYLSSNSKEYKTVYKSGPTNCSKLGGT